MLGELSFRWRIIRRQQPSRRRRVGLLISQSNRLTHENGIQRRQSYLRHRSASRGAQVALGVLAFIGRGATAFVRHRHVLHCRMIG